MKRTPEEIIEFLRLKISQLSQQNKELQEEVDELSKEIENLEEEFVRNNENI